MSVVRICDVCGKRINKEYWNFKSIQNEPKEYDFCTECQKKLKLKRFDTKFKEDNHVSCKN